MPSARTCCTGRTSRSRSRVSQTARASSRAASSSTRTTRAASGRPAIRRWSRSTRRPDAGSQSQALAYSLDKGRTFTFYSGNPVIDIGSSQFRDPKVFWHEPTKRWVMVVAMPDDHQVAIYGSPNLKQWELLSKWGPLPPVGGQYEVPDLFPLNVDGNASRRKWVMIISTNPGGLWGGSLTAAYIGDFDGTTFKEDARYAYAGAPGTTTVRGLRERRPRHVDGDGHGVRRRTDTGPAHGSATGQRLQGSASAQLVPRRRCGDRDADVAGIHDLEALHQLPRVGRHCGRRQTAPRRRSIWWSTARRSARRPATAATRSIGSRGTCRICRQVGADRRSSTTTRRPTGASSSTTSASPTPRRCPASSARRGSTGARTTTPASRSTTLPDGRRLFVGWLNNWQYAQSNTVPTTAVVARSAERAARAHAADRQRPPELFQVPLRELNTLRAGTPVPRDQPAGHRRARRSAPPARCSTSKPRSARGRRRSSA